MTDAEMTRTIIESFLFLGGFILGCSVLGIVLGRSAINESIEVNERDPKRNDKEETQGKERK